MPTPTSPSPHVRRPPYLRIAAALFLALAAPIAVAWALVLTASNRAFMGSGAAAMPTESIDTEPHEVSVSTIRFLGGPDARFQIASGFSLSGRREIVPPARPPGPETPGWTAGPRKIQGRVHGSVLAESVVANMRRVAQAQNYDFEDLRFANLPGLARRRSWTVQTRGGRTQMHIGAGWPLECLTGTMDGGGPGPGMWAPSGIRSGGNSLLAGLPYHPIPETYAASAAIYGLPAFALLMLPTWVKLLRRRILGRCRKCGYDRRGIEGPCPECGAEPAAQKRAATP